jgi:branched-chain amino acid aminotransferase
MSVEERQFSVDEMIDWVKDGDAALSGTAAVLAGVGTLIRRGQDHIVGTGEVGPETRRLRAALVAIQQGETSDPRGWCKRV